MVSQTTFSITYDRWDTSVGSVLLADQFLQISTKLPTAYLYGFGETSRSSFKRDFTKWHSLGLFSRDQAPYPYHNKNLYGVHPFYLLLEEDGSAHGVLLLNSNAMDITLQPLPALTYRTIGGVLDFYFFFGPTPEEVVQQYTELIGRPVMPSYWSLGFQLCRYGYNSLAEVRRTVARMSKYDIPQDIQYGDIDYMKRQLDFTYDNETYNGLPEFVRNIKEQGIKYITILDPAISAEEPAGTYEPYDLGKKLDIWIKDHNNEVLLGKVWPDKPGVKVNSSLSWDEQTKKFRANATFPDWFHENITSWWNVLINKFHDVIDFDGLWIDMNEPANFVKGSVVGCTNGSLDDPPYKPKIVSGDLNDKTVCMSAKHQDGEHEYNYHSLFGWKQSVITREALSNTTNKRGIVISRSTYPSSGKYVGHWLGDNKSNWTQMHESIIGMMDFSLFGIPYSGADICGFNENTTYDLCLRWMHLGAFYPMSRNHNGLGFKPQDPAVFGEDFARQSRDILQVRYSLLPYLYTLFFEAHTKGSTVVRPLFHEFPGDRQTWLIDRQFLWGQALLITPILEKDAITTSAYFPKSRWYDYFNGRQVENDRTGVSKEIAIPVDKIGLHIRGGTVIPTQKPANNTKFSRRNSFGLIVALNENETATGSLFWDDGDSLDSITEKKYLKSEYFVTGGSLNISIYENGYTESNLHYEDIRVFGVKGNSLQSFSVNGEEPNSLKYTIKEKVLEVYELRLPINEPHLIKWKTSSSSTAGREQTIIFMLMVFLCASIG